jgi:hypothetical protein
VEIMGEFQTGQGKGNQVAFRGAHDATFMALRDALMEYIAYATISVSAHASSSSNQVSRPLHRSCNIY